MLNLLHPYCTIKTFPCQPNWRKFYNFLNFFKKQDVFPASENPVFHKQKASIFNLKQNNGCLRRRSRTKAFQAPGLCNCGTDSRYSYGSGHYLPGPVPPLTNHIIRITSPITGSRGITRLRIPPTIISTTMITKTASTIPSSFQYHLFRS